MGQDKINPERLSFTIQGGAQGRAAWDALLKACRAKDLQYFVGGSIVADTNCIHLALRDAEAFNQIVMEAFTPKDCFRFAGQRNRPFEALAQDWATAKVGAVYDIMIEEMHSDDVVPKQRLFSRIQVAFWFEQMSVDGALMLYESYRPTTCISRITPQTFAHLSQMHIDLDTWDTSGVSNVYRPQFPIDIVYTWVDDQDPDWVARKDKRLKDTGRDASAPRIGGARDERFRNNHELLYSLRSVALFAPWVRHIFLVTDDQVPAWLRQDHPKITVVSHRDIFKDHDMLPCFNSSAIESRLHHIPGLSEHFIYFNDDVFLGQAMSPDHFFFANGQAKFFPSPQRVHELDTDLNREEYLIADASAVTLLKQKFGFAAREIMQHTPHASRRSVLLELEHAFPDAFEACARQPFRSPYDLRPIAFMQHGYSFMTHRAVPGTVSHSYISLSKDNRVSKFDSLRYRRHKQTFCINDALLPPDRLALAKTQVSDFLMNYFPFKSEFEK